jgi:hypothetical protein
MIQLPRIGMMAAALLIGLIAARAQLQELLRGSPAHAHLPSMRINRMASEVALQARLLVSSGN